MPVLCRNCSRKQPKPAKSRTLRSASLLVLVGCNSSCHSRFCHKPMLTNLSECALRQLSWAFPLLSADGKVHRSTRSACQVCSASHRGGLHQLYLIKCGIQIFKPKLAAAAGSCFEDFFTSQQPYPEGSAGRWKPHSRTRPEYGCEFDYPAADPTWKTLSSFPGVLRQNPISNEQLNKGGIDKRLNDVVMFQD